MLVVECGVVMRGFYSVMGYGRMIKRVLVCISLLYQRDFITPNKTRLVPFFFTPLSSFFPKGREGRFTGLFFKHILQTHTSLALAGRGIEGEGRSQHINPRDGYKPPPTKRNNPLSPAFSPRGERVVLQAHSSNTYFPRPCRERG
jgi:hypothetical protein